MGRLSTSLASGKDSVAAEFVKFDKEDTGLIDRDLLVEVLGRLDPVLFTKENCDTVVAGLGCSDVRNISWRAFLDWIFYEDMPLKSMEGHRSALDSYVDDVVNDIRGLKEAVDVQSIVASSGTSPQEIRALQQDLTTRSKEYMRDAQRKNIRPIWEEFDSDHDGVLAKDECRRLLAAYLERYRDTCGDMVRATIEFGLSLQLALVDKVEADPAKRAQFRERATAQVEALHAKVVPRIQEVIERMQAQTSDKVVEELLLSLDKDHDGRVVQAEFESGFIDAMQNVLGPERMMEKLQG